MIIERFSTDASNVLPGKKAGEALSAGELVYLASDGTYKKAKAIVWARLLSSAVAAALMNAIGFVTRDVLQYDTVSPVRKGLVSGFSNLTVGLPVYLSPTTAGGVTQTKPYEAQVQQPVGIAVATDTIDFDIDVLKAKASVDVNGAKIPVYTGVAAAQIVPGNICGINSVGQIALADATAASALIGVGVAGATILAAASGTIYSNMKVLTSGKTAGTQIYLSKTAGAIADSDPAAAEGDLTQELGTTIGAVEYRVTPNNIAIAVHA